MQSMCRFSWCPPRNVKKAHLNISFINCFLLSGFTPGCSGSPHVSKNERAWSQLGVVACTAVYRAGLKKLVYLYGSQKCRIFLVQPGHGVKSITENCFFPVILDQHCWTQTSISPENTFCSSPSSYWSVLSWWNPKPEVPGVRGPSFLAWYKTSLCLPCALPYTLPVMFGIIAGTVFLTSCTGFVPSVLLLLIRTQWEPVHFCSP